MTADTSTSRKKNVTNILIIDRSRSDCDIIKKALEDSPDIEVTGTAIDGKSGLTKALALKPDIVLLDAGIEDYDPAEFVVKSLNELEQLGIILTLNGAPDQKMVQRTIATLENGAFDFIEKLQDAPEEQLIESLKRKLLPKIRTYTIKMYSRIAKMVSGESKIADRKQPEMRIESVSGPEIIKPKQQLSTGYKVVTIGVSTGGPEALTRIIPLIPPSFPLPVLIVLHMPVHFTASMASDLNKKSNLTVKESVEGDVLKPGYVFLARGGQHMTVKKGAGGQYFLQHNDDPPEHGCRPSVDALFRSVSETFKESAIAVILTGMGIDGAKGMGLIKQSGSMTIAQDEESSVVWGMPEAAVKAGIVDEVLPLNNIPERLIEITGVKK
ncbi:hypothetical protein LCGC14_2084220 [marine sediment metagenome]|uniref:protein-glutamate methylesterase n=1 Tax=marine sediment metagenome TaxID=412755 RepID=A0A0F9HBP6_9ZZZZ